MSENSSARTPESGQKALEDIQPEHGALVRPAGPPVSLGPNINPFWSESAREEALLRACRPAHLPREGQETTPPPTSSFSPQRDPPEAFRAMMQSLWQENARLWSEREAFVNQGMWRQQAGSYGPQQSWLGNVLGEGLGHERSGMGAMMEVMKSTFGSGAVPRERGMLGALSAPVESSGGGIFQRQDPGVLHGLGSLSRGSLMEFFNMVSGGGPMSSGLAFGGVDLGRRAAGPIESGLPSERSARAPVPGTMERVSESQRESRTGQESGPPEPQGGPSVAAGRPGDSGEGGNDQGGSGVPPGDPPLARDSNGNGENGRDGWRPSGPGFPGGAGGFPGGFGGFPGGDPHGQGGFPNGFFGGGPPGGGGFPHGFPGGPPGGPPGGGDGGAPAGPLGPGAFGQFPAWLGGLMAQQESVRAVDLPTLPELSESEVGPLLAGDWLTTIGPFLRDMSTSSTWWWDEVLRVAGALYRMWLESEPMERLRLVPISPPAFQTPPWLRIEQRGSVGS